jgi:PAP2 superfamily protein
MTTQQPNLVGVSEPAPSGLAGRLARWAARLSLNDWLVSGYLLLLNVTLLASGPIEGSRARSFIDVSLLFWGFTSVVLVLIRGNIFRHPVLMPFTYRVAHYGCTQLSYFALRAFLPNVNPRSLDGQLHQLDLTFFGLEPAVAMQHWVSHATSEWFAFFYYGYFFVLGLHIIPILFFMRDSRLMAEFTLGMQLVICVGQSLYMLVPGFGPALGMPHLFDGQLPPGVWWNLVGQLVSSAGAQKDIFPSVHTAAPTFILLFSFHNRRHLPFRYTWPFVWFFSFNIIIATMFLRWHWIVDIVAGLMLALGAHFVSVRGAAAEAERRKKHGLPPAWPEWPERRRSTLPTAGLQAS